MPPAPPALPVRPNPVAYHFHTYDYPNSAANGPFRPSAALGNTNWQFYSLEQDLNGLFLVGKAREVPNLNLFEVGLPTTRGRRTKVLSFGNLDGAPAPTVVITGGVHAREWIAPEIAYLIAEYLIVNYPTADAPRPLPRPQALLKNLVDTRNIRIIPMVNPDGNHRTVFGPGANDRFWRKNRRRLPRLGQTWIAKLAPGGVAIQPFTNVQFWTLPAWAQYDVPDYAPGNNIPPGAPGNYQRHRLPNDSIGVDLNRNMSSPAWGFDPAGGDQWNPDGETFFGIRAAGEAETKNLRQFMATTANQAGNIAVTIDYHSYGKAILYPGEIAADLLHQGTGTMLRSLIKGPAAFIGEYELGTPLEVFLYDGTGTIADHAATRHGARAFTIELDPTGNLGDQGFVLPEASIQAVFEKNIRGALAAIAAPADVPQATNFATAYAWSTYNRGNQLPPA
jgi:hypothetical protein